jgi:hypothetical protein
MKDESHASRPVWDRTSKPCRGWRDDKFRSVILVGNKFDLDLDSQRQVSKDEGEAMAKELEIGFRECSAKSGSGVEEVMFGLVRIIKNEVAIYTKMKDKEMMIENKRKGK